jgi:hypothetical protein
MHLERPTQKPCGPHVATYIATSLFGLASSGVYHRRDTLPYTRCALTAPFHPYRSTSRLRRFPFCCTIRRLTPPRRYLALYPMKPGLSSLLAQSDCLANSACSVQTNTSSINFINYYLALLSNKNAPNHFKHLLLRFLIVYIDSIIRIS